MTLDIIVSLALLAGVFLTCIPAMPGILLMFLITVVYGVIDKFATLEPWHFAVFGGITVLSMAVDAFSGVLGAKIGGANRTSLLYGMIGLFVGLVIFPPFGAFLGLFVGVFAAEAVQFKDHFRAFRAAATSLVAAAVGMVVNMVLALAYLITFLIIVF